MLSLCIKDEETCMFGKERLERVIELKNKELKKLLGIED